MTQTEAQRRLAQVERELTRLKVHAAELDVLVRILLNQASPTPMGVEGVKQSLNELRRAETGAGLARPHLRLVADAGSVSGQDLDEGLRRVRAGQGDGR
jgi:hypothetical protein